MKRMLGAGIQTMAEANPKRSRKRSRVAKGEDFQVQHLAETTDLSPNQARELLRRHGDDWRKIDEAAGMFKGRELTHWSVMRSTTCPLLVDDRA